MMSRFDHPDLFDYRAPSQMETEVDRKIRRVTTAMRDRTIAQSFTDFHRSNPWVYRHLVSLTREMIGKGHKKIGIKMLYEVLRWQTLMGTHDEASDFKLCNNYHSRYARLIMDKNPDLDGVFELRELRA